MRDTATISAARPQAPGNLSPSQFSARRRALAIMGILTALFALSPLLPDTHLLEAPRYYLPLHTAMEFFAVAVSILVFAIAWNIPAARQTYSVTLLACAFLAVGLIDFVHAMNYNGMPAFITDPFPGKATSFWLAARIVAALALLAVALLPQRENVSSSTRTGLLAGAMVIAAVVIWAGLFRPHWIPPLFIEGQGLTAWKIGTEYLLFVLHASAFMLLWRRSRQQGNVDFMWLAAATWTVGLSELYFTLYSYVTDIYNLVGHVYKVAAYAMVYRAVFITSLRQPYTRLEQETLRANESESRYADIIATAMDGVVVCDSQHRIVLYNAAAERLFGYDTADIIGKKLDILMPAESAARHAGHVARFADSGAVRHHIGQINRVHGLRSDGSEFPAEISISKSSHGGETYFTAIVRDISAQTAQEQDRERMRAELAQRVTEKTAELTDTITQLRVLETAIDSSLNAIAMSGLDGRITYINAAFLHLWGLRDPSEAIGRSATEFWSNPSDAETVIGEMLHHGSWQGTLKGRHADGHIMDIELSAHLARNSTGQPVALMASFIDITERKRSNEQVRDALKRLNEAQHLAMVGSWELDLVSNQLIWSDEIYHMFEVDQKRFGASYEAFLNAIHPDDREMVNKAYANSLTNRTPYEIVHRLMMPDGRIKYVRETCESFFSADGKPLRSVGTVQDITEMHKAELELRASEERFSKVFHNNPVAAAVRRLKDDVIIEWNPAFEHLLGYHHEDIVGKKSTDLGFSIDPDLRQSILEQIRRREAVRGVEMQVRTRQGETAHILTSVETISLRGEDCLLASFTDITERKLDEQLRGRLSAIIDASPDFIGFADAKTARIHYINTAGRLMCGIAAHEDVTQLRISDVHPEWTNRMFEDEILPKAVRDGTWHGECAFLNRDGQEIPVSMVLLCHRATDGTPEFFSTISRNITDRKRTEEELRRHREDLKELVKERTADLEFAKNEAERSNKAKSEFLSRMSHELRTPMNAILGFAQILEIEKLSPEQKDFVHEIHSAGDHLLELINELLDLSRIEAGKLATVLQPVPVDAVVTAALQIVQPLMAEKRIVLFNKCTDDSAVLADPTRLKQILVNLLSNAAKYNRDDGHVLVGSQRRSDGILRISVTDTGPGIPADKLNHLFKPFERLGAEFGKVQGTGIGLALSRQLAELMGGTLGLDSTHGEGSTFWVDLPLATETDRKTGSAPMKALPESDTGKIRVLYVEDNPANLKVVESLFRHYPNLQLLPATNGEHGLELARRYRPDAILLDIHLPGMDGYAVFDALKTDPDTKDIPVIALSADAMPIDIEKGLKAGFRAYLTKPVKMYTLTDALTKVLKQDTVVARETGDPRT